MIKRIITIIALSLGLVSEPILINPGFAPTPEVVSKTTTVLAEREFSMEYRYRAQSVSDIFKDNILLNLAYLNGTVTSAKDVDWDKLNQSFNFKVTLNPNETFAYHDRVLPEYEGKIAFTTNTYFNKADGYKTSGLLYGDGVCQLASLLSWAAKDANLLVKAPSSHDFAAIPEVPKSEGVSIYYDPNNMSRSANQNLYITNNQTKPVDFVFDYQGGKLKISVTTSS